MGALSTYRTGGRRSSRSAPLGVRLISLTPRMKNSMSEMKHLTPRMKNSMSEMKDLTPG